MSSDPTTFSVAFQWTNKWEAAGPLLAVAWGINEVAARGSICDALLMKYKDTVLLTRAPTHSSPLTCWGGSAGFGLCRCVVFNGDKVNFSICQSALQPTSCALHHTIGPLSEAIHLNFPLMQCGAITESERMSCRRQNIKQGWKLIYFKVSGNMQFFRWWTAWYIHRSKQGWSSFLFL